ncbi:MAG: ribosome biogenesis GTPase Der [Acidimicrobiales bacterium]
MTEKASGTVEASRFEDAEDAKPAGGAGVRRRLPLVVVAGRPNVGKSTLFNRVVGRRAAVVEELPGVTRDVLRHEAEWNGRTFEIADTGGWKGSGDALDSKVAEKARHAIEAADLVLVVVDVTVGPTTEDEDVARIVKRAKIPSMLVANKVDNTRREAEAWELVALGLGDPHMVSALHGRRTGELLDEVVRRLGPWSADGEPGDTESPGARSPRATDDDHLGADQNVSCPRVAIVGRPNVGKSTLFNRLVGEQRSVVHDVPGTTRDSVDTLLETADGPLRFVDTAGMRRHSRSASGTEYYAMVRALQAIDDADVVLLVVDAIEGVTHQDQRLAERIGASGSPVVLVLNKWERVPTGSRPQVTADLEDRLAFLGDAPVLKISAMTGLGVHRIHAALRRAVDAYNRRVPTGELNRVIAAIQSAHAAPGARIRFAVQGATEPPTFTLFATRRIPATYLRYVERRLREEFDLGPTPLKLRVRLGR